MPNRRNRRRGRPGRPCRESAPVNRCTPQRRRRTPEDRTAWIYADRMQQRIADLNRARWRAALAGIAAAAAGVGAAELVAVVLAPSASPLFAAGSLVVDLSPLWLKNLVI